MPNVRVQDQDSPKDAIGLYFDGPDDEQRVRFYRTKEVVGGVEHKWGTHDEPVEVTFKVRHVPRV